ncbi:MAG: hypothetical protein QM784_27775 [Polyangiaceae bacterium]
MLLHRFAAKREPVDPERQWWPLTVKHTSDYRGSVQLELMKGTPADAERAMGVLRTW